MDMDYKAIASNIRKELDGLAKLVERHSDCSDEPAPREDSSPYDHLPKDPILRSIRLLCHKLNIINSYEELVISSADFVAPFCEAIELCDVQITYLSLRSLLVLIKIGIINDNSPSSLQLIAESITKINQPKLPFKSPNDGTGVEFVYWRVLEVSELLICNRFRNLTNDSVSEILIYCFQLAHHSKLSEWLRTMAAEKLLVMCQALFESLHLFEENQRLGLSFKMRIRLTNSKTPFKELIDAGNQSISNQDNLNQESSFSSVVPINQDRHAPFGLPLINDLFCYLASLINPAEEERYSEEKILLGLRLLSMAFQSSAHVIKDYRCLLQVIKNDICWNILMLLKTPRYCHEHTDRPLQLSSEIFSLASALAQDIFVKLRAYLKYQFEAFIMRLMELMDEAAATNTSAHKPSESHICSTCPDFTKISLTTLVKFFNQVDYLPYELYYNYDCDQYAANIFKDFIEMCSKNSFPPFSANQQSSFECLLASLSSLHKAETDEHVTLSLCGSSTSRDERNIDLTKYFPRDYEKLVEAKRRKRLLWTATEKFNASSKPGVDGIKFIKENGLITNNEDLVDFLRDNPKINKTALGKFLSEKGNDPIRNAFIQSINVKNSRIDEALRTMLDMFRLAGESQLIERILVSFSSHWRSRNPKLLKNDDAALSLSYAIIILNVDQHKKGVQKRMTLDDFVKNLKGQNAGDNFDFDLLKQIYFNIQQHEIKLPDDQEGIIKERFLWKCLLRKGDRPNGLYWSSTRDHFNFSPTMKETMQSQSLDISKAELNKLIFNDIYRPTVAAMSFIFDKIDIKPYKRSYPKLANRVLTNGFAKCARLCATYGQLDNLIITLCKLTTTGTGPISHHHQSALIDDEKNRLAATCLFTILDEHSNHMRESWSNVVEIILKWYCAHLLDGVFQFTDFALNNKIIHLRKRVIKKSPDTMNQQSFFNNFLSGLPFFGQSSNRLSVSNQQSPPTTPDSPTSSYDGSGNFSPNSETLSIINTIDTSLERCLDSQLASPTSVMNNEVNSVNNTCPLDQACTNTISGDDNNKVMQQKIFFQQLKKIIIKEFKDDLEDKESFLELIKALISASVDGDTDDKEEIELFKLEIFIQVVLVNGKRIHSIWKQIDSYIKRLCSMCGHNSLLGERIISSIFRMPIRFLGPYKSLSDGIFTLLDYIYLNLDPAMFQREYTAIAMNSMIVECHQHIKKEDDWRLLLKMLLYVGINLKEISHHKYATLGQAYKIYDPLAYDRCIDTLKFIVQSVLVNNPGANNIISNTITVPTVSCIKIFVEGSVCYEEGKKCKITEANCMKLLELLDYLHSNAFYVMDKDKANLLWSEFWCPLLQSMATFCCDIRYRIRYNALELLQRALILHELHILDAQQLESCFNIVLFPFLTDLLKPLIMYPSTIQSNNNLNLSINGNQSSSNIHQAAVSTTSNNINNNNNLQNDCLDKTRNRAISILCKVFLHHLTTLQTLPTFAALWLSVLDIMDNFMKCSGPNDQIRESIPQSLKNMLLVMEIAGCLQEPLKTITWDKIMFFLPTLKSEVSL